MKKSICLFLIVYITLIVLSCKSADKKETITKYDQLNMVIKDYYKRNKSYINKYGMFHLEDRSLSDRDYYVYNVFPINNDYIYVIDIDESLSNLPSDYIEYKGKIFFVEEKIPKKPTGMLLQYLDSLHLLDSTRVKLQLGLIKDEDVIGQLDIYDQSLKGLNFIICKESPDKIKKRIISSKYLKPDDEVFNICN